MAFRLATYIWHLQRRQLEVRASSSPTSWNGKMQNRKHSAPALMLLLDRPSSPPSRVSPTHVPLPTSEKVSQSKNSSSSLTNSPYLPPNPPPTPRTPTETMLLSSSSTKESTHHLAEFPPSPPPSPPLSLPRLPTAREQDEIFEFSGGLMNSKALSASIHGKLPAVSIFIIVYLRSL